MDFNACLEGYDLNSKNALFLYLWSKSIWCFGLPLVGNVLCGKFHFVPSVIGDSSEEKNVKGLPGEHSQVEAYANYLMGQSFLLISQL